MLSLVGASLATHCLYSIIEWTVHRCFMHDSRWAIGRRHLAHHARTRSDMSLEEHEGKGVRGENLYLAGPIPYATMLSVNACLYLFYTRVCSIGPGVAVVIPMCFSIWQVVVWNTMHASMHGRCGWREGNIALPYEAATSLVARSRYCRWVVSNHTEHHATSNAGRRVNYNIVFPGADLVFSTYGREISDARLPPMTPSPCAVRAATTRARKRLE
jgi:hypothetical protein